MIWFVLGLFFAAHGTLALGAIGKTLEECYAAALQRSEIVANSVESIDQAEQTYWQAIGAVLPTISAFGSYFVQQAPSSSIGSTVSPSAQPLLRVSASQPLFQGFKEYAGLRQAGRLAEASRYDKAQAQTQLYLDLAQMFLTLNSQENDLENIQNEIALYEKRIRELKEFERVGRSRISEVLTAEANRASLAAQAEQIKGQIQASRKAMAFLTGFENDTSYLREMGPLRSVRTLDEYLAQVERRPDVMGENERRQAAEASIGVARAGHFPTIALSGNYYLLRFGALVDVNWDFQVTATLPIFNGGIIQSQVAQAVSKRDQAENLYNRVRRLARQQVQTFFSNYEHDTNQWKLYSEAAKLSEENYKQQSKEYRLGLVTNLDVLQALTNFQENKRAADRTYFAMKLDLESLEAAATFRKPPPSP